MKKVFYIPVILVFIFNCPVVKGMVVVEDGLSHTIDYHFAPNHNVYLDWQTDNNPGTHFDIVEGGTLHNLNLENHATATFTDGYIEQDIVLNDFARMEMSGGYVHQKIYVQGNGVFEMNGGSTRWMLIANSNAEAIVSGGTVGTGIDTNKAAALITVHDGVIYLDVQNLNITANGQTTNLQYGDSLSDFGKFVEVWEPELMGGELMYSSWYEGIISGTLADGSPIDTSFQVNRAQFTPSDTGTGDIIIIPEPNVIALLGVIAPGLWICRRWFPAV